MDEIARLVRILAGDGPHVSDIVHDTVVRALDSLHRFDPTRPVRPWLCGIAIKVCHKHWRRIQRARRAEALQAGGGATSDRTPESELVTREDLARLREALDGMSPRLRDAVVLTCCEGFSVEEVARMTGGTPNAVYTRVCRARELLRKRLGAGDDGGRGTGG